MKIQAADQEKLLVGRISREGSGYMKNFYNSIVRK